MEHVVEKPDEFEAELAAVRLKIKQACRFMDNSEARMNVSVDELELMKEEMGNMRTAQGKAL